jgi:pimeloyl-ACP methyl ester carboxylesterase
LNPRTFVLVHGAWHDGSCWSAVANILQSQGHTVFTPDLPGHGRSAIDLAKVTLKAYVTSLVNLLETLDGKTVLVGHSMSGMVISEVACRIPQKVSQLVYISAYLPRDRESLFDLIALNRSHEPFTAIELAMHMSGDKRICHIDKADVIPLFYNLASHKTAARAEAVFGQQATLPLAAKVSLNKEVLDVIESTYICCTKDKVIPLHHQHKMLRRRPCNTVLELDADHSPFYSLPSQLAALLEACAG